MFLQKEKRDPLPYVKGCPGSDGWSPLAMEPIQSSVTVVGGAVVRESTPRSAAKTGVTPLKWSSAEGGPVQHVEAASVKLDSWVRQLCVCPRYALDGTAVPPPEDATQGVVCAGTDGGWLYTLAQDTSIVTEAKMGHGVQGMDLAWGISCPPPNVVVLGLMHGAVVWVNPDTGRVQRCIAKHRGFTGALAHMDARYFFSGANDTPPAVVTDTLACEGQCARHNLTVTQRSCVWSATVAPNSCAYFGSSAVGVVDMSSGEPRVIAPNGLEEAPTATIRDMCTADNGWVIAAGWEGKLSVWDPIGTDGRKPHSLVKYWKSPFSDVNCCTSRRQIAVFGGTQGLLVYSLDTFDLLQTLEVEKWSLTFVGTTLWASHFGGQISRFTGFNAFREWDCMLPHVLSFIWCKRQNAALLVDVPMDVVRLICGWVHAPPFPQPQSARAAVSNGDGGDADEGKASHEGTRAKREEGKKKRKKSFLSRFRTS